MVDINDLRQQRAGLAAQARALLTQAQNANRDMLPEEEQTFDRLMADADALENTIQREERTRALERAVGQDVPAPRQGDRPATEQARQEAAFRAYLLNGRAALDGEQVRALNMGNDPEGGYLVAPQQWVEQLLQAVDDAVPLRGLATVMRLTEGESLGVPTLETDLGDAEWTGEVATGSQDDALRLGKRELRPNPLAKRVRISRTLLRRATLDPETLVRERLAVRFGYAAERAYMVGDGNKKPLGIFTASADGISTGRDVSFGTSGDIPLTLVTGDQLIEAKHTLKAAYWRNARWLWHRGILKYIRKIKEPSTGNYAWQPGLASDRPDTVLDLPYVVSEFAPSTVAANNYVGALGDFSYYWIADALDMEVQRLVELYAESNQVGFIGRQESDGMPVLEEAFIRLKVPA